MKRGRLVTSRPRENYAAATLTPGHFAKGFSIGSDRAAPIGGGGSGSGAIATHFGQTYCPLAQYTSRVPQRHRSLIVLLRTVAMIELRG
jgi:hypothetical protein